MKNSKGLRYILVIAAALALAACDGKATVDLAVSGTDAVSSVTLPPSALHFMQDGGSINDAAPDASITQNLNAVASGATIVMVSDAKLAAKTYTGLALDFDATDASVTLTDGTVVPVTIPEASLYQPMSMTIDKNDSATRIAVLDLRFSLANRIGTLGSFYVRPYYRVVDPADQGTVSGSVATSLINTVACEAGRALGKGVAVYAWSGSGVTPHDFVSTDDTAPVASAPVTLGTDGVTWGYQMPYLASGNYTIALTCQGDQEDPLVDQGLAFSNARNVSVSAGAVSTSGFP